ncbi:MAG: methionyl-tRNA formyltransferase-like protein [Devosia sp.]|uniref:methionyl-tRNA formyltransferase-like protein n=1 Tax=Devosia sp. TaxID=1871048 RepID=UPI003390EEC7
MQELSHVLEIATAAIEAKYFNLPIDGGSPIYRERVYCYELYHQLRRQWPIGTPFSVNGEIDKKGHLQVQATGARAASPDFLVHIPGSMSGNHAIIEVKPGNGKLHGIRKDLRTLTEFQEKVGYQRAIYLFYGHFPERKVNTAVAGLVAERGVALPAIEFWLHASPGPPASLCAKT